MKMTIDEKIENFRALLYRVYQAQKTERLIISSEILTSNGFNLRELEEYICPSLHTEGILRERQNFLRIPDKEEELTMEENKEKGIYVLKSTFGYEFIVDNNKLIKDSGDTSKQKVAQHNVPHYLVTKDSSGNYSYRGKRIEMEQETIYYKTFDILYISGDQNGFVSYEDIEKNLIKRELPESQTEEKRNKRIVNAVSDRQGLFRFAKVSGKPLKNKTLDGHDLIEIKRGKGLKLNNPNI